MDRYPLTKQDWKKIRCCVKELVGTTPEPDPKLLDLYPADAAYSLRQLSNTYTGPAIRVRRSSDNAEQDIGFVNGLLDEAALTTFVGANDGYVVTWYDQSGNELNLLQSTAAYQPSIISSGTVRRDNGKVAIYYDGTNDGFIQDDLAGEAVFYPFFVLSTSDASFIVPNPTASYYGYAAQSGSGSTLIKNGYGTPSLYVNNTLESVTTRDQVYMACEGYNIICHANASLSIWANWRIFNYKDGEGSIFAYQGYSFEMVFYFSNQDSNRSAIFNSINRYYSIY